MKLHHTLLLSAASFFTLNPASVQAQLPLVNEVLSNPQNEPAPVHPVPAPRQLKWQETEFYAFAEKALAVPEVKGLLMEAVNEHNRAEQKERC